MQKRVKVINSQRPRQELPIGVTWSTSSIFQIYIYIYIHSYSHLVNYQYTLYLSVNVTGFPSVHKIRIEYHVVVLWQYAYILTLNWIEGRCIRSLVAAIFFFLYNIHYCVLYILMGFLARFHLLLTFLTVIVNQIFLRTKIFRTQNMFACTLNTHTHKCALVSLGVNCICGLSKCSRVEPFFLLEQTRKKNTKIDKPHESDCRCCCYSFDTQRPVNQRRRFISPSI